MDKTAKFLKNALMGERVGAFSRSSKYVVASVINDLEDKKYERIVEYGPGDGVLTIELLKKLGPNGRLLLVELDKNFIKDLKKINDKRITIIHSNVEEVSKSLDKYGFGRAELIVSSIPFTFIKKDDREKVVRNTKKFLAQNGKFIIFHQYSLIMSPILKKLFSIVRIKFEPRNFLPCFIITASK